MTRRATRVLAAAAALAAVAGLAAARSCGGAPLSEHERTADGVAARAPRDVAAPRRRSATPELDENSSPVAADDADARPVAPAPPAEATVEFDVVVRDPVGRLVPGVAVTSGEPPAVRGDFGTEPLFIAEDAAPPATERSAPPTTDASGRVRLRLAASGALHLVAASDAWFGRANVAALPAGDPAEIVIDVVPAFRLSGSVAHEDGRPVPGAIVCLGAPLPGREPRQPIRLEVIRTDEKGRFVFGVHPVPDTRLLECYLMGDTMAGNAHRFLARAGAMDVALVAPRGTMARGRCVDEEGRPLGDVRIRGFRPGTGEITFTGGDGRFALPVPANGGGLLFYFAGRVQTALRDVRGPPEGVDVGDVLIPRGGVVAGCVVDAEGRPLAGMNVSVIDPRTEHHSALVTSGADGAFRAEPIGAGDHFALVWGARPGEPEHGVLCAFRFEGLRAGTNDAVLTVPRGVWAHVEICDAASGAACSFAKGVVTLTRDDGPGEMPVHRVFESEPRSAFDVQLPGPGAYLLQFELPVTGTTDRRRITVGDEPLDTIVLTPR
jgi:hypothetical protein